MTKNPVDQTPRQQPYDGSPRQKVTVPNDERDRNRSAPEQRGHDNGGRKDQ
jgi:hypothetical protein